MYLVVEGNDYLIFGNEKIRLEAGFIYLIPSFIPCTYHFEKGMSHYYVHFGIDNPSRLSFYHIYSVVNKKVAVEIDKNLFPRLVQINPNLQLPHHEPNVFQTKLWLTKKMIISLIVNILKYWEYLNTFFRVSLNCNIILH